MSANSSAPKLPIHSGTYREPLRFLTAHPTFDAYLEALKQHRASNMSQKALESFGKFPEREGRFWDTQHAIASGTSDGNTEFAQDFLRRNPNREEYILSEQRTFARALPSSTQEIAEKEWRLVVTNAIHSTQYEVGAVHPLIKAAVAATFPTREKFLLENPTLADLRGERTRLVGQLSYTRRRIADVTQTSVKNYDGVIKPTPGEMAK